MLLILKMLGLVILQNASFTLVSRARNSDSVMFHAIASVFSNGLYLLVFKEIVLNLDKPETLITYIVGSVIGSISMHMISMKYFEKKRYAKIT